MSRRGCTWATPSRRGEDWGGNFGAEQNGSHAVIDDWESMAAEAITTLHAQCSSHSCNYTRENLLEQQKTAVRCLASVVETLARFNNGLDELLKVLRELLDALIFLEAKICAPILARTKKEAGEGYRIITGRAAGAREKKALIGPWCIASYFMLLDEGELPARARTIVCKVRLQIVP
jgi:hypothetical protein